MSRLISWFSCGAASAVATKLCNPDVIAYCETGSEDRDNKRFMSDCQDWFSKNITILKSEKFDTTWDVWKRGYISGVKGAPCTYELKVKPRLKFQRPDDIHVFGYTADWRDIKRAETMRESYPDLNIQTPLIERGITKVGCLDIVSDVGISPPRIYSLGFPNANCIPCCKASSPAYWSLIREHFPDEFDRLARMSREFGSRLTRISGQRCFIDEIPIDYPKTEPLVPECDMLCWLVEQELAGSK